MLRYVKDANINLIKLKKTKTKVTAKFFIASFVQLEVVTVYAMYWSEQELLILGRVFSA